MNQKENQYHGIVKQSFHTENFNISITHHQAHSTIPLHAHDKPYLCLSIAGYYDEKTTQQSTIKPGTVLFRRAQYEHANQFRNKHGICLNLEFNNHETFSLRNQLKLPDHEFERHASIAFSKLFIDLNQNIASDILNIRCHEVLASHFEKLNSKGKLEWIHKVKQYIHDDPSQRISLDEMSAEFQLHPNYIVRKFKTITGYKLSEYLEKVRLESALQQFYQTNNKLSRIGLDSGFYDQSHFIRSFKKQLQTSPGQFRNALNNIITNTHTID